MAIRYTFKVFERLKREQHIKTLFQTGKAFSSFPLKCIWLPLLRDKDELSPVRIAVSVPKKRIPLSVNRYRIKRLIRESWRLQKHTLYPQVPEAKQLHLFFIYTGPATTDMEIMHKAMGKIIQTLTEQLNNSKDA